MILPRDVRSVRVAPRMAHRWGADRRRMAEEKIEKEEALKQIRQAHKDVERYSDLLRALSFGFRARNSGATIGEMYPVVKANLADFHNYYGQLTEQEVHRLRMSIHYNSLTHM